MKRKILKHSIQAFTMAMVLTSCGIDSHMDESTITNEFKVYGNCGMCEKTIEGALNDLEGIDLADWDKNSKLLEVSYDSSQLDINTIKEKIAEVGYDTDTHRATDEAYSNLHSCCQYERP